MALKTATVLGISVGVQALMGIQQGSKSASKATGAGGWGMGTSGTREGTAGCDFTVIVDRMTLKVAPELMHFKLGVLSGFDTAGPSGGSPYDPRIHDLDVFWSYGDAGSAYLAPLNLPAVHTNANEQYLPEGAHVFTTPGDRVITCLVVEPASGKWCRKTFSLSANFGGAVLDPDVMFAGASTIYVDPDGGGTAPPGATVRQTLAQALGLISGTDPKRIMLRGVDHAFGSMTISDTGAYIQGKNCYIVGQTRSARLIWNNSNGTGPALEFERSDASGTPKDVVLYNFDILGPWNPVTETVSGGGLCPNGVNFKGNCPRNVLLSRMKISGFATGVGTLSTTHAGVMKGLHDLHITDWYNFGVYDGASLTRPQIMLGCRIAQNVQAGAGGVKIYYDSPLATPGYYNIHGPYRDDSVGGGLDMIWHGCDLFSNTGWFLNRTSGSTQQACIRYNQNSNAGRKLLMSGCSFEGGWQVLSLTNMNADTSITCNMRLSNCVLVGSYQTANFIMAHYGGLTLDNCLMVLPAVYWGALDSSPVAAIHLANKGETFTPITPMKVRNCTFLNLRTTSAAMVADLTSGQPMFSAVAVTNSVIHQPNLGVPDTAAAPLDTAALWAPRQANPRWNWSSADVNPMVNLAPGGTLTIPYSAFNTRGETGLTQADFVGGNGINWLAAGQDRAVWQTGGDRTITFGPTGVTFINNSATDYTVTQAGLDRRTNPPPAVAGYASAADTVRRSRPLTGSPAIGAATGVVPSVDMFGVPRPGSHHPDAPGGAPTKGALEPA